LAVPSNGRRHKTEVFVIEPYQTFFRFVRSPSRLSIRGQPAITEASPLVGELTQTPAHAGTIRTPRSIPERRSIDTYQPVFDNATPERGKP
jgi:hypothetical protein